jgi:hypothetical protein
MNFQKFRYEPARVRAVIGAGLALLVGYGLLTSDKAGLWSGILMALLAAINFGQGESTRAQAVPLAKVEDAGLDVHDINVAAKANTEGAP